MDNKNQEIKELTLSDYGFLAVTAFSGLLMFGIAEIIISNILSK